MSDVQMEPLPVCPMSENPLLSVRDLRAGFAAGRAVLIAVAGVSFDLHAGETLALLGESQLPHVPVAAWSGTTLALPRVGKARGWRDALTGHALDAGGDQVPLGDILSRLPVALLEVV